MYVYITGPKKWQGPYKFMNIDGETVVVQLESGRKILRSNCVRPAVKANWSAEDDREKDTSGTEVSVGAESMITTTIENQPEIQYEKEKKKTKAEKNMQKKKYASSLKTEIEGIIQNGTFEPTRIEDVPVGKRIFGSSFIDHLKQAPEGAMKKRRLVVQNYSDHDVSHIATRAPTVQRY